MENFFDLNIIKISLSFLLSVAISYWSIPSIVSVAKAKHLYDEPNGRTSHKNSTPTLGGLAIFAAVIVSMLIFFDFTTFPDMQYVVGGSIILFFIGIKDDILSISPYKKLFGQIVSSLIIIILGDIRFTSLHGFLNITFIPYVPSVLLTLFVMIVIINCFNLIDGIDGLASGIAMVSSLSFAIWFGLVREWEYVAISAALIGSLLAFFYFNVWGTKNKIFMGDTGSLLLGLFMSVLVIQFNELNIYLDSPYQVAAAPAISFGILMIPLYDTMRVFVSRTMNRKSPFYPDKTHVHHRLLKLGNSHLRATGILMIINVFFILLVFCCRNMSMEPLFLLLFLFATMLSYLPVYLLKRKNKAIK
jgi:UDP-N-acetylmuramyl pentapeptide phosphotransferase/UDP-N-acetylglucosamine-1-phosphate transferase